MPTCPPNLRHSFLTGCDMIKLFSIVPQRYSTVFGAKKTIFGRRYGFPDFTFLFLVELRTCVQNLIFTKVVEGCQKNYFPQRGMLIQMPFFDNKNSIWIILGLKIRTVETCSSTSCTRRNLFIWKTLKSQFLVQFRSFIFGQILANYGSFGQIWAEFAPFIVAKNMPKLGLKSSKPLNFWTLSPNVTCNGSLESYHPYV
jgi:hypothetical protein